MKHTASFRFYAELNDFLPPAKKQKTIGCTFDDAPSVKDAIEAQGVPHPEIDLILVNGAPVTFSYKIQNEDHISVYPEFELLDISSVCRLRPRPLREPKFITDRNLGRLVRKMRLLGFDTLYSNAWPPQEIIRLALNEKRIILTRSARFLMNKRISRGYWVRAQEADKQTAEVVQKFDLFTLMKPFSRCSVCNGLIKKVPKEEVIAEIPERTKRYFNTFYRCEGCGRVYWEGTHYQKIVRFIEDIKR